MKKWVVELADGSLNPMESTHKPQRADYVKVLDAPAGMELTDGPHLSLSQTPGPGGELIDIVILDQAAKDSKKAQRDADKAAEKVDRDAKKGVKDALKALKKADLKNENDIKDRLLEVISLL